VGVDCWSESTLQGEPAAEMRMIKTLSSAKYTTYIYIDFFPDSPQDLRENEASSRRDVP
jgi:hypothetical protein